VGVIKMRKLSQEDFLQKIKERNPHYDDIEIISCYIGANEKVACRCKTCKHEWSTTALHLIHKTHPSGCPNCANIAQTRTHEEFLYDLAINNKNYETITILGKYTTKENKIKCMCKICNNIWNPKAGSLLQNNGCSKCGGTKLKSHQEFIDELKEINELVEILGQYKNDSTNIECKCLKCGNEWKPTPNKLLHGRGCPKCKSSKGEDAVRKTLKRFGVNFDEQYKFDDCRNIKPLRYDFAILNNNYTLKCLIEYQGMQHYELTGFKNAEEIFERNVTNDTIKREYCVKNNIKLIEIAYWEFNNIENILKEHLL
jgi:Zn finger protein HypA/HybF involved in hydrogenase expression